MEKHEEKLTTEDTETTERAGVESVPDSTDGTDQAKEGRQSTTETTEDTERVRELAAENARLRAALAEARIEQELVWAAEHEDAVNPAQVAKLMKDQVRLDKELQPMIVDANGDWVADAHGLPVTVGDAVRAFLEENPHLVMPTRPVTGGGSGGPDATALTGRTPALTGGELIAEALREERGRRNEEG